MRGQSLIFLLTLSLAAAARAADTPDYKNPDLSFDARVDDLVKRLTLEQKAGQLQSTSAAIPELGLPALNWYSEAGHGLWQAGRCTCFPIPTGMSATWDPALMKRVGDAISDEARANYEAGTKWRGLIFFCPMVNLTRDPRWGRAQESYGEDPVLTGNMAGSFIQGMQGNDPKYSKVLCELKHFAMHSQETNRMVIAPTVSEHALREYYLPAFRTCAIDAHAFSIMTAFSGINGVPCAANKWLLTDVLRNDWHFTGAVTTDNRGLSFLMTNQHYADSLPVAAAAAINAGVDVMVDQQPSSTAAIVEAVNTGLVKPAVLDQAVAHALMARFKLGLMDPPDKVAFNKIPHSVITSKEHLELAQQVAVESTVLLKNDPAPKGFGFDKLLPLDIRKIKSIAILGPYARIPQLGGFPPAAPTALSPLDAITAAVGDRVTVRVGDLYNQTDSVKAAAASDVAIVVMGLTPTMEKEGADRQDLELPRMQLDYLKAILKANPCTVVVLQGAGAMNIQWIKDNCPAIMLDWYPGEGGGPALADMLLGRTAPAGRLPVTYYRSSDDLPALGDYELSDGRTYMFLSKEKPATYVFGHGLAYTTFSYANIHIDSTIDPNSKLKALAISADITNTGERDGEEVAQLYFRSPHPVAPRPLKQLKAFQRIAISKGQTVTVHFSVPFDDLRFWDEKTHAFALDPGNYEAQIGASSDDIRLKQEVQLLR